MSLMLSPAERLARDVRHLTARIPRVAEVPTIQPPRKTTEERKPRIVSKVANLAKRLRDLEKVPANFRGKSQRIDAELVAIRQQLESMR